MSFSLDIKEELAEQMSRSRLGQLSELSGLLGACGSCHERGDGALSLVMRSENILVIRKASRLLGRAFRLRPEVRAAGGQGRRRLYTLAVPDGREVSRILEDLGEEAAPPGPFCRPACERLIQSSEGKRAWLRGSFLGGGSLSDPRRFYHFEMALPARERAEQIRTVMQSFEVDAKMILRRKSYVVYVKESDGIADMLNIMGAHRGLMDLENIRILREMRGSVNRSVNCETANLGRTVSASVEQIRDIEKIREEIGLDSLPPSLQEMAEVRLEYPDLSLRELGLKLDPPVGKSGVNHRLRRLKAIAEDLQEEGER